MIGTEAWRAVSDKAGTAGSEEVLLALSRSGDRDAIARLLGQHEASLLMLCKGILGRTEEAEDAVQETFLRALRSLGQFRGGSAFKTWLFRIAVNVSLEWKRARRAVHPLTDEHVAAMFVAGPDTETIQRIRLTEALLHLLPRHRAIILLRELHGFSVTEIGEMMGWSRIRVQNELYKARKALAEWRASEEMEGNGL